MKRFILAAAVAALVLPSVASAITITSGTNRFNQLDNVYSGSSAGNSALQPNGFSGPDYLFSNLFYIRAAGTARVNQWGSNNTPTVTTVNSLQTRVTWTNAGFSTDRWDISQLFTLVPSGNSTQMAVTIQTTLTNKTTTQTTPQAWGVYWLLDMDIPGTNVNAGPDDRVDLSFSPLGIEGKVVDTTDASRFGSFAAPGATRYEFGDSTTSGLRVGGKLGSGATGTGGAGGLGYNLASAAPTSGTASGTVGSFASAVGWNYNLAFNDSVTFTVTMAANQISYVPEPTALGLLAPVGMILARRRR